MRIPLDIKLRFKYNHCFSQDHLTNFVRKLFYLDFNFFLSHLIGSSLTHFQDLAEKMCRSTGQACAGECPKKAIAEDFSALPLAAREKSTFWFKPSKLSDLYRIMEEYNDQKIYLVVGHTGHSGGHPDIYVDMKNVVELNAIAETEEGLTVGANVTIADLIALFYRSAKKNSHLSYLREIAALFMKTAHPAVRNVGKCSFAIQNKVKRV